jgi:hypothetical protein
MRSYGLDALRPIIATSLRPVCLPSLHFAMTSIAYICACVLGSELGEEKDMLVKSYVLSMSTAKDVKIDVSRSLLTSR